MSEASSPNLPAPGFASKSESGTSSVNVNVGSPNGPEGSPGASFSKGLKDYWPMIVFLIGAVFSAGVLWQKVDTLEEQQSKFEQDVKENLAAIHEKLDDLQVVNWTLPGPNAKTDDF